MLDGKIFLDLERAVFQNYSVFVLKFRKSRVNRPVKNVALQYFDHFRRGVYLNRTFDGRKQIVDIKRQAGNMIEMRV